MPDAIAAVSTTEADRHLRAGQIATRTWFAKRAYLRFRALTGREPESLTLRFGGNEMDFECVRRSVTRHPAPPVMLDVDGAWWYTAGRRMTPDQLEPFVDRLTTDKVVALRMFLTSFVRQCPAPTGGCDL